MQLFYSFFRHSSKRRKFIFLIFKNLHVYRNKIPYFVFCIEVYLLTSRYRTLHYFLYTNPLTNLLVLL